MGTWLRQPLTQQERREWMECEELMKAHPELHCRRARSKAQLPTHRDDLVRRDADDRSWKRHRSSQYRSKPNRVIKRQPSGTITRGRWLRSYIFDGVRIEMVDYWNRYERNIIPFRCRLKYQKNVV